MSVRDSAEYSKEALVVCQDSVNRENFSEGLAPRSGLELTPHWLTVCRKMAKVQFGL
jgi:hypothetical protein